MKKSVVLLFLLVGFALSVSMISAALPAYDVDNVTIFRCGFIDLPGEYILNQSIEATGNCISISNPSVTLDCNGSSITGDSSGAAISLYDATIVKNCIISNFQYGLAASGPAGFVIDNNTIYSTQNAVYLSPDAGYVNITNNEISDSDWGINFYGGSSNVLTIENNEIYDIEDYGMYFNIPATGDSVVQGNTINNVYLGTGIYAIGLGAVDFIDNDINGSYYSGMYFNDSDGNTIFGGLISNNNVANAGAEAGIALLVGSDGNTITGIEAHDNKNGGAVYIGASNSNTIEDSNIHDNCGNIRQIYIADRSDGTIIQNNNITDGTGNGVEIIDSIDTDVLNNNISGNFGAGVYIYLDEIDASGTLVDSNTIDNNGGQGSSYWGVSVYFDDDVTISNNNFSSNAYGAIYSQSSIVDVQDGNYIGNGYDWNNQALYAESGSLTFTANNDVECTDNAIEVSELSGLGNIVRDNCPISFIGSCGGDYECGCGDIVIDDYTMTDDLLDCPGNGLEIGADDITLDCDGYKINHSSFFDRGISIENYGNITIENCEIEAFAYGIYIDLSDNDSILNNYIHDHESDGIYADGTENLQIENNNITNANNGIYIENSGYSTISSNLLEDVNDGIDLIYVDDSTIEANILANVSDDGILLVSSEYNFIQDNTIECAGGGSSGIYLTYDEEWEEYSDYNNLSGNDVSGCGYGLYAEEAYYLALDYENYYDNDYGAYLFDCNGEDEESMAQIYGSNFYDNGVGVYLDSTEANIIDSNFTNNDDRASGLHVDINSHANLLNGNFEENDMYGIYDEPMGVGSVEWTITEDVNCINNDILISSGWIVALNGAKINADNCTITVEGVELDTEAGETGSMIIPFNIIGASHETLGSSGVGIWVDIFTNDSYEGNITVTFYSENPGDSGFYLEALGIWMDVELSSTENFSYAILRLYYTDELLDELGLDEDSLIIEYYDGSDWEEFDTTVNKTGNYVEINTTHFSIYGVYGSTISVDGGSSGGSWITSWTSDTSLTDAQLAAGATKNLSIRQRITYGLSGLSHYIGLTNFDAGTGKVTLELASVPKVYELSLGETKEFDVTGDGKSDISITVDSIATTYVTLTVKLGTGADVTPSEESAEAGEAAGEAAAGEGAAEEEKGMSAWAWVLIAIVIAAIAVVAYSYYKKKKEYY